MNEELVEKADADGRESEDLPASRDGRCDGRRLDQLAPKCGLALFGRNFWRNWTCREWTGEKHGAWEIVADRAFARACFSLEFFVFVVFVVFVVFL